MASAAELASRVSNAWPNLRPSQQLSKAIEANGLVVQYYPFDTGISGCLSRCGRVWVIGVNLRHPEARQRFTMAHELGHFLAKHPPTVCIEGVDWAQERFANRFAASLLMPVSVVRSILDDGGTSEDVAMVCQVSLEAAVRRVKELHRAEIWK